MEMIFQQTKLNNERNGHHYFKRSAVWLLHIAPFKLQKLSQEFVKPRGFSTADFYSNCGVVLENGSTIKNSRYL